MPLTFSHPLAVVPLRRFFPAPLNFVALVVGSMTPDLGYYLHQFPLARFAHTAVGSFVVCLPSGLLGVGLFCLLQRPLCFMLPQPHRAVLAPLIRRQAGFSWRASLLTAACVLIGAWTHTAWDAFTHANGWAVERLAFLRAPLAQAGGTTFPVYYILQQASTVGGGLGLAALATALMPSDGKNVGAVSPLAPASAADSGEGG